MQLGIIKVPNYYLPKMVKVCMIFFFLIYLHGTQGLLEGSSALEYKSQA